MGSRVLLIGSSAKVGLSFYFTRLALAIDRLGNEVVLLSGEKQQYPDLSEELSRAGISHYVNSAIDGRDPISMIRGTKILRTLLSMGDGFDIIHAGGIGHIADVHAARRCNKKSPRTLVTVGWLPKSNMGRILAMISYNCFGNKLVALCDYTQRELEKIGVESNRIEVVPLFAPDLNWFDSTSKKNVPLERYHLARTSDPTVFYGASHFYHKGFSYYLKAAAKALEKHDATFIIGGYGPLTESLKNLARKLRIHEHVVFTGWISNYHMPYVLSNIANICVSTSLFEQLPSYLMECMAAGKPIVATNVGGVSEIVRDGMNGYLTSGADYDQTADKITELLDDPNRGRQMGLNGRKLVENKLNLKTSVLKLTEVYNELMKN